MSEHDVRRPRRRRGRRARRGSRSTGAAECCERAEREPGWRRRGAQGGDDGADDRLRLQRAERSLELGRAAVASGRARGRARRRRSPPLPSLCYPLTRSALEAFRPIACVAEVCHRVASTCRADWTCEYQGPESASPPPADERADPAPSTGSWSPPNTAAETGEDSEPDDVTGQVEQPAKVMRIGTMIKQLLEEVRPAPLDEAGRTRLREIHETSIRELEQGLSPELREELQRLTPALRRRAPRPRPNCASRRRSWSAGSRACSTASRRRCSPSSWPRGPAGADGRRRGSPAQRRRGQVVIGPDGQMIDARAPARRRRRRRTGRGTGQYL